jgi:MSHA biogenesis protein MshJ
MIGRYWEMISSKVDELSLRERALIFAAAAFLLVSLANLLFLDPLWAKQKRLSAQIVQQNEKMKEVRAQIEALSQAQRDEALSPLRQRIAQLRQQIAAGDAYVRGRSDRLVPAQKMAGMLEQMLNQSGHLQLVHLQTLPVASLVEQGGGDAAALAGKQVFKHGVRLTVRGSYPDMLEYLQALENLPAEMFWGSAKLEVLHYPEAELTLTLYTLSLDKTWLAV